jgi:hypothetical protein
MQSTIPGLPHVFWQNRRFSPSLLPAFTIFFEYLNNILTTKIVSEYHLTMGVRIEHERTGQVCDDSGVSDAKIVPHKESPQGKVAICICTSSLELSSHAETRCIPNPVVHLAHNNNGLGFRT